MAVPCDSTPPVDPNAPRNVRRQQRQLLKLQLERERLMLQHQRREPRRGQRVQAITSRLRIVSHLGIE